MGKGYEASLVKCDICTHTWVAVRPVDVKKLECPNCGVLANYENIDTSNNLYNI